MTNKASSPDWPHSDQRWRAVTYLDYLNANPREQFERSLQLVACPTLTAEQPKEYADFDGWSLGKQLASRTTKEEPR